MISVGETRSASGALSERTVPQRDPAVVTRAVGGETVLVPVRARVGDLDHIYTLGEVGTFIWNSIDGSRELGELTALVVNEFAVEPATASADLLVFVSDLREAGLVGVSEKP